jgi:hypothetical protein
MLVCLALLIALVSVLGTMALGTAQYGYIYVDINPSFRLTVNRFYRVMAVEGIGETGKTVLSGIDPKLLQNAEIKDVTSAIVSACATAGYLPEEGKFVLISSYAEGETIAKDLNRRAVDGVLYHPQMGGVSVNVAVLSRELIDEAATLGISPGKLRLARSLEGGAEVWASRPVGEIFAALNAQTEAATTLPDTLPETTPEETTDGRPSNGMLK